MQWARIVDPASAPLLPPGPGVYRFRDQAGQVLYIGRAISLRRRVLSYWGDLGDRGHLAPMVARIARVEAAITPGDSAPLATRARTCCAVSSSSMECSGSISILVEHPDRHDGDAFDHAASPAWLMVMRRLYGPAAGLGFSGGDAF